MIDFNTVSYDLATLKTYNPSTGTWVDTTLQGNMYTVDGITDPSTGELRRMSIAELVMAICLARAADKEEMVINLMKEMTKNSTFLEALTSIEEWLLNNAYVPSIGPAMIPGTWIIDGQTYDAVRIFNELGIDKNLYKSDLIPTIETKMDSMNSFSQQKMIELQSETNKRDQAYDMITNILKSLNTVQTGNANNI